MINKMLATAGTAALLAAGAGLAAPAQAAPVVTGGLVNITVTEVLNDNVVTVTDTVDLAAAINIAANVCDVSVNVLAEQTKGFRTTCTNTTDGATATITQRK